MTVFDRYGVPPSPMQHVPGAGAAVARLTARIAVTRDTLLIAAVVSNTGTSPIYLLGFLWRLDRSSTPVLDPEGAYRSTSKGTLRVYSGVPPLPRGAQVFVHYLPFASTVAPGGQIELERELRLPVTEYNPYFNPDKLTYNDAVVSRVELVLQLVTAHDGVTAKPSPWAPGRMQVVPAVSMAAPQAEYVIAGAGVPPMSARQAVGSFARLELPGDAAAAGARP